MGEFLKKRLHQSRFDSPVQEALLNLIVAAAHVQDRLDQACVEHGISVSQYNVLRILRGAHPQGLARCDITRRMLERSPDVTRLIDRLERRGLAERARSDEDRRLSVTRITRKGLGVLDQMRPEVEATQRVFAGRLSPGDVHELSRICEAIYGADLADAETGS